MLKNDYINEQKLYNKHAKGGDVRPFPLSGNSCHR